MALRILHKKPYRMGPGLCGTSENPDLCEVRSFARPLIRRLRTACELRRHSPGEQHHNENYERVRKRGCYRPPKRRVAFHVGTVARKYELPRIPLPRTKVNTIPCYRGIQ
jgi:hypothetical protein